MKSLVMKRSLRSVLFSALVLLGFTSLTGCGYNSMVEKQEAIDKSWSQVENVYQRRADLIPNLVNTVKGAANFEQSTLTAVIEARAKATSVRIDPRNLDEASLQKFEQAQGGLSSALGRLMVVSENYPELKANANFQTLMTELERSENRIAIERKNFNDAVGDYNTYIRKFPNNLTAGMFDFKPRVYFKAAAGSEKAPEVKF